MRPRIAFKENEAFATGSACDMTLVCARIGRTRRHIISRRTALTSLLRQRCIGSRFFNSGTKLDFLCDTTFELAKDYELTLQAWAFFANHYHLVISFHNTATAHRDFVRHLHRANWRYSSTAWMLLPAGESCTNFGILA